MIISTGGKLHNYNRGGLAIQVPDYALKTLKAKRGDVLEFIIENDKVEIRKVAKKR